MVYIEVQDKKLKFGIKKKKEEELQSVSLDWYSIGIRSIENRSIDTRSIESHIFANVKSP